MQATSHKSPCPGPGQGRGLGLGTRGSCPFCGAPPDWRSFLRQPWESAADAHGWQRREFQTLHAEARPGASYERKRPSREPTFQADVAVPVLQSAVSGVVTGILGGATASVAGVSHPWLIGLTASAAGLGLAWVVILREHRQALWEVERFVAADLDRDGHVGLPSPESFGPGTKGSREPVRVEVIQRDSRGHLRQLRWLDLPPTVTEPMLERLARAVLVDGTDFSRRKLNPILSAEAYGLLAARLLQGGLLRYKGRGENAGVELTPAGRAFLRRYLNPEDDQ